MNDEVAEWLGYARENLQVAELCFESGLYNPSLQNSQQTVEKALKALLLSVGKVPMKIHNIATLSEELLAAGVDAGLTDSECKLLNGIYLPSKYPLGSVFPHFDPNEEVTKECLSIAQRVLSQAMSLADTNR